jgi:hypothetical protein
MSDLAKPLRILIRSFLVAVLATVVLAVAVACAWSQTPPPAAPKSVIIQVAPAPAPTLAPVPVVPLPAEPVAPPAAPAPAENPGLINELGKLFKDSTSILTLPALPSFKGLGSTDSLTRLNTIVKGRVACPRAANGAPDCKTASDRLCQSKGFKEGKSLDTDAAQSCSPRAMVPGRKPEEGDCTTENYVTQALCQ